MPFRPISIIKAILYERTIALCASMDLGKGLERFEHWGDSRWFRHRKDIDKNPYSKHFEKPTKNYLQFSWARTHITVCTVVQNCCNGCSKKHRKWHFWGCSLSETFQRIDIKFGRGDYAGDGSQCAKWHINRFRDVISTKGWNVNGLYFKIFCSFFRGQTVGPILTSDASKCVFLGELYSF